MERLLSRLENVNKHSDYYKATCPSHSDTHPSLIVSLGTNGRVLLKCLAGCKTETILNDLKLGWSDLFLDCITSETKYRGSSLPSCFVSSEPEGVFFRDEIYTKFLSFFKLDREHKSLLEKKGIVNTNGFKTLNMFDALKAIHSLKGSYQLEKLAKVPGFIQNGSRLEVSCTNGLAIPVLNLKRQIQGIKIRTKGNGSKYIWMSHRTNTVGSPLYQIRKTAEPNSRVTVSITEGPLKAIRMAQEIEADYTIAVPGVSNCRHVLPFCLENKIKKGGNLL